MYDSCKLDQLSELLVKHKHTISVAESVTSGHLQAAFSTAENATLFYEGGMTAYNITQKYTQLHVNPVDAMSCNCVSESIAEQMAAHIRKVFSSDWGIGITGYASKIPGGPENLFSCYAIVFREETIKTQAIISKETELVKIQEFYTCSVLNDLINCLQQVELVY